MKLSSILRATARRGAAPRACNASVRHHAMLVKPGRVRPEGEVPINVALDDLMRENLKLAYETSDKADLVRTTLIGMLDKRSYRVGIVLRRGWQSWMQATKDHVINLGIVGALLLSVILGLAIEPPDVSAVEDGIASAHQALRTAFACMCGLSSVLSIHGIIAAVYYVKYVDQVVCDVDDWLTFDSTFRWA